jgi:biotin transporter BioY
METAGVIISFLCFFLSINFGVLSVYVTMDEWQKKQLLAGATSFFVGGTIVAVLLIALKISHRFALEKERRKPDTRKSYRVYACPEIGEN